MWKWICPWLQKGFCAWHLLRSITILFIQVSRSVGAFEALWPYGLPMCGRMFHRAFRIRPVDNFEEVNGQSHVEPSSIFLAFKTLFVEAHWLATRLRMLAGSRKAVKETKSPTAFVGFPVKAFIEEFRRCMTSWILSRFRVVSDFRYL